MVNAEVTAVPEKFALQLVGLFPWLVLLLGLSVLLGWFLHLPALIQINPAFVPMQFNTALGFVMAGLSWLLYRRQALHAARFLAVGMLVLGLITLLQYVSGWDLGLDQLFMQHYIVTETSTPGRMAPNTALCFVLTGLCLLLATRTGRPPVIYLWSGISAMLLGLALLPFLGYLAGLQSAYGWGSLTRMAVHTSVGFLLLALVSLAWANRPRVSVSGSVLGLSWSVPLGSVFLLLLVQALESETQEGIVTDAGRGLIIGLAFFLVLVVVAMQQLYLRTQSALERASQLKDQLRSTLDAMIDSVIVIDGKGIIQEVNQSTLNGFGYQDKSELLGQNVKILMPEHHSVAHDGYLANYLRTGEARIIGLPRVLQAKRRDGSQFPMKLQVTPNDNEQGRARFTGVIHDLSEYRALEQESQEARELFTASVTTSPVGFIIVDEFTRISYCNEAALRWFGGTNPVGDNLEPLLADDNKPAVIGAVQEMLTTPGASGRQFELALLCEAGEHYFSAYMAALADASGRPKLALQLLDISERVALAEALTSKNLQLEEVNRELDRFAYVASHDLKSPLNAIKKLSGWIIKDCRELLPDESRDHLQLLQDRTERMSRLLDDLLAYSRLGRLNSDVESVSLEQLGRRLVDTLGVEDRVRLSVEDATLNVARVPFEMVLRNLLDNAVKHHPGGAVTIEIWSDRRDDFYRIYIQDDGSGIDPAYSEKIFELFTTLKPRDDVEGSGMGLAVCRKLVESYGGRIGLEKNQLPGACFTVDWPMPHKNLLHSSATDGVPAL